MMDIWLICGPTVAEAQLRDLSKEKEKTTQGDQLDQKNTTGKRNLCRVPKIHDEREDATMYDTRQRRHSEEHSAKIFAVCFLPVLGKEKQTNVCRRITAQSLCRVHFSDTQQVLFTEYA